MSQTEEQREAENEREVQRRVARAVAEVPDMVAHAVEQALQRTAPLHAQAMAAELRRLAGDAELMDRVASHFQQHALRTWKEWLGGKVWNFVLTVTFGALLAWLSFKQWFGGSDKP